MSFERSSGSSEPNDLYFSGSLWKQLPLTHVIAALTLERFCFYQKTFSLCSSLIRIMDDQTVVLSHFSVQEYLLSSHIAQRGQDVSRFALQEEQCRNHIFTSVMSYIFSIGLRLQSLEQGVIGKAEFPLTSYIMEEKVLERRYMKAENLQAELQWTERLLGEDVSARNVPSERGQINFSASRRIGRSSKLERVSCGYAMD